MAQLRNASNALKVTWLKVVKIWKSLAYVKQMC